MISGQHNYATAQGRWHDGGGDDLVGPRGAELAGGGPHRPLRWSAGPRAWMWTIACPGARGRARTSGTCCPPATHHDQHECVDADKDAAPSEHDRVGELFLPQHDGPELRTCYRSERQRRLTGAPKFAGR